MTASEELPFNIATQDVFESVSENDIPSKEEMLDMLDEMILSYEHLPRHAMESFATNADLHAALLLIAEILRSV